MPTLTHPKRPGKTVTVSQRTAKQYAKAGWTEQPQASTPSAKPTSSSTTTNKEG